MRWIDRVAASLVLLFGLAHLAAGDRAFLEPSEPGVWFLSAGFLLILIGMANLACATRAPAPRLAVATGLAGGLSILVVGALLAAAAPASMTSPQALVLLALGLVLTALRARQLLARPA